jgi:GT2 family glycosyltransferase
MSVHVAICIVGFRNGDDIARCVAAIEAATYPDFEIVICENGGEAAAGRLLAMVPPVLGAGQGLRVIQAPGNLGFAGGINLCLAATPAADAWWLLNPDTEPGPEALAALVARLEVGDCDAVGCTLYRPDGRIQSYGGRWRSWLSRTESLGIGARLEDPVDAAVIERAQNYLNGASMLVGRRFLETAGPMREDYFLYCEEVEWCVRALNLGLRLGFAPAARVLHAQGTTTGAGGAARRRARGPVHLNERNKILMTRDLTPARVPVAAVTAAVGLLLRYGRRGAWRQFGWGLAGWWAGLRGERGAPPWMRA